MNLNLLPITTNGTTSILQTIASNGYQIAAFVNGSAGSWGGASIAIQIVPNNTSQPITIATLTQTAPFVEKIEVAQGLYLQAIVTGATSGTSLNFFIAPLGVYGY